MVEWLNFLDPVVVVVVVVVAVIGSGGSGPSRNRFTGLYRILCVRPMLFSVASGHAELMVEGQKNLRSSTWL